MTGAARNLGVRRLEAFGRSTGLATALALCIPAMLASALIAKGVLQFAWVPGAGYDLRLRWTEAQYFIRGINPAAVSFRYQDRGEPGSSTTVPEGLADVGWPEMTAYPPTSTLTQLMLFGWPLEASRLAFVVVNLLSLAVLAWWAGRAVEGGWAENTLMAGMALANLGYSQSVINGNYGVIVMAALVGAIVIRDRHPILSGVLLGIALVKPTMSGPFALLFLHERRYRGLLVCAVYLVASLLLTMYLTGDGARTLIAQSIEGMSRFSTGGYALWKMFTAAGLVKPLALALNGLVLIVPFLVWITRTANPFSLTALAVTAIVARLFTYHNSVDNVLVSFVAVAVAVVAWTRRDVIASAIAVAVMGSVLVPFTWTDSIAGHSLLYATWILGAAYVVLVERVVQRSTPDAGQPVPGR